MRTLNTIIALLFLYSINTLSFISFGNEEELFNPRKEIINKYTSKQITQMVSDITTPPTQAEIQELKRAIVTPIERNQIRSHIISRKRFVKNGKVVCEQTIIEVELKNISHLDKKYIPKKASFIRFLSPMWNKASDKKRQSVILVPPTGGYQKQYDQRNALTLCENSSLQVIAAKSWDGENPERYDDEKLAFANLSMSEINPRMHDLSAVRTQKVIQIATKLVKNDKPIGIIGTSVGAITSTLALGTIDKIKVAVLIAGGSDMPQIISESEERKLVLLKKIRSTLLNWDVNTIASQNDYLNLLQDFIHIDSTGILNDLDEASIKMHLARNDKTVPTKSQYNLYNDLGGENNSNVWLKTYAGNHLFVIGRVYFFQMKSNKKFLIEKLNELSW